MYPALHHISRLRQGGPFCNKLKNGNPAKTLVRLTAMKRKHRFPSYHLRKNTTAQVLCSLTLHGSLILSKPFSAPLV